MIISLILFFICFDLVRVFFRLTLVDHCVKFLILIFGKVSIIIIAVIPHVVSLIQHLDVVSDLTPLYFAVVLIVLVIFALFIFIFILLGLLVLLFLFIPPYFFIEVLQT